MATMFKFATIMQTHMRPKRIMLSSPLNLNMRAFFSSQQKKDLVDDEPVLSSPCLILPQNEAINETYQTRTFLGRCFYDLGKKRFLRAPEEHHSGMMESEEEKMALSVDARCVGSSHGWLAFFNHGNRSIYLMNPLTLQTIPLPHLDTLFPLFTDRYTKKSYDKSSWIRTGSLSNWCLNHSYKSVPKHPTGRYLQKVILSSSPDSTDCKVLMSWNGHEKVSFAFCRIGNKKWTKLYGNPSPGYRKVWTDLDPSPDIVYINKNKKFYGVRDNLSLERGTAEIYEWNVDHGKKETVLKASISFPEVNDAELDLRKKGQTFKYLVESSSGEILLVLRYRADHVADGDVVLSCEEDPCYEFHNRTIRFDIYKLDPVKQKLKFVKNLGDQALFVGVNHSFSLSASEFPEIKPNSIYFTDHHSLLEHFDDDFVEHYGKSCGYMGGDFGIFSLEDNTISPCYRSQTKMFSSLPFWLEPPQRSVRF